MPFVNVNLIKGVFTPEQKQEIIARVTDTMVGIEGESMRQVTWVTVEEVDSGIEALTVYEVGPSVGAHTGPGTIGVVYAPASPPSAQVDENGDAR